MLINKNKRMPIKSHPFILIVLLFTIVEKQLKEKFRS